MLRKLPKIGTLGPVYPGATLGNRTDNYLADRDPKIFYRDELAWILDSPHVRQFINEASKAGGGTEDKAAIPRNVYFALGAVALVALVASSGCISIQVGDDFGDQQNISEKPHDSKTYESNETKNPVANKSDFKTEHVKEKPVLSSEFIIDGKKAYKFGVGTLEYAVEIPVSSGLYNHLVDQSHSYSYLGSSSDGRLSGHHNMFLDDENDDAHMRHIINFISSVVQAKSEDEAAESIIQFVQSGIDYDEARAFDPAYSLYPYETFFTGKGNCGDKALLLAELLKQQGYGVVLFHFDNANHLAVGLKVPDCYGSYRTEYCFIEPTIPAAIGKIPEKYAGGVSLDKDPKVTLVSEGMSFNRIVELQEEYAEQSRRYGHQYLYSSAYQKVLLEERADIQDQMVSLNRSIISLKNQVNQKESSMEEVEKQIKGILSRGNRREEYALQVELVNDYNRLVSEHNEVVRNQRELADKYNKLVESYNSLGEEYNRLN